MRRLPTFFSLAVEAFRLGVEAQAVIGLRLFQAATGAASPEENSRMISEKVEAVGLAHQAAALAMAAGRPDVAAERAMRVYRGLARANRRRLTAGR